MDWGFWRGVVCLKLQMKSQEPCFPDLSLLLTSEVTFGKCLCHSDLCLFILHNPGEDYVT